MENAVDGMCSILKQKVEIIFLVRVIIFDDAEPGPRNYDLDTYAYTGLVKSME